MQSVYREASLPWAVRKLTDPERKLHESHQAQPLKFAVASLFCAAPLLFSAPVRAAGSDGYLTTSEGSPVRASGQCVHTSAWHQGDRFADCEPAPVVEAAPVVFEAPAPIVEAPAPVVVAPLAMHPGQKRTAA